MEEQTREMASEHANIETLTQRYHKSDDEGGEQLFQDLYTSHYNGPHTAPDRLANTLKAPLPGYSPNNSGCRNHVHRRDLGALLGHTTTLPRHASRHRLCMECHDALYLAARSNASRSRIIRYARFRRRQPELLDR
jgi:hypothetical protein